MPYIIRPRGVRKIAAALFGTVLLIGAVPAAASAACPTTPTSAALAQFGDNASYSLLSGSTFESGAEGWSLFNSQVVSTGGANGGSDALAIQPMGSAVSPAFCVNSEDPSFRFFVRQISGSPWASLKVILRWTDEAGSHTSTVATLQHYTSWELSSALELAGVLALVEENTLNVSVQFKANWAGAWEIDDVYIDPYSR